MKPISRNTLLLQIYKSSLLVLLLLLTFQAWSNDPADELTPSTSKASYQAFVLPREALKALDSGVPITLNGQFVSLKPWLFWKLIDDSINHRFEISRHALSNHYLVKQDDSVKPKLFRSASEASNYVQHQCNNLLRHYAEVRQVSKMRITLDQFVLPAPLRLAAFINSDWQLKTDWIEWPFAS